MFEVCADLPCTSGQDSFSMSSSKSITSHGHYNSHIILNSQFAGGISLPMTFTAIQIIIAVITLIVASNTTFTLAHFCGPARVSPVCLTV